MTPSNLIRIFVSGKLRVVDDEIRSVQKFAMLAILTEYVAFSGS